jgi:hypothetical protein
MYESFKMAGILSNRFTQAEMLQWLSPFKDLHLFEKSIVGTSAEGKEIALYRIGNGTIKAMLWSQMHGDEPTATMALMDVFNFLLKNPEHIIAKTIQDKMTLLVIPMLNPDGAERFTRRNAQMIDLNRDALELATPEANILKSSHNLYKPEYGFNLHDQEPRYTVGATSKITAVSLLAPPADESREDNPVRLRAKKVASTFAQIMKLFIPDNLAKWEDTFYPNAFGDSLQKWGTSTVLIESGGWRGDPDKFFIRKLNCIGLLAALYTIANGETRNADVAVYEQIPFNTKLGCDFIIRNAVLRISNHIAPVRADVGINFDKRINTVTGQIDNFATIVEIGDLNAFASLEKEDDAGGAELNTDLVKLEHSFTTDKIGLILKRT